MERRLYILALQVGAHLLARRRVRRSLRYLVEPVPYWRSLEFRIVWEHGGFSPTDTVLDIGSPKLLSLYLGSTVGAEVYATDIEDYFVDEYRLLARCLRLPADRYHVEVQDGRRLGYPDASFSKVFSISVLEHIPDYGDKECVSEIGRVLKPGGSCLITVPFWPESKEVYRGSGDFYWARSSSAPEEGRVFFQRRYSEADLHTRLIEPSGLQVEKLLYVGERVLLRSERELCDVLPRVGLGPIFPLLSRAVHTQPAASWRDLEKPLCAFLKLRKPL